MRLNDTTRAYFEQLAAISSPERAAIYKALLDPTRAAGAQTVSAGTFARRIFDAAHLRRADDAEGWRRANVIPSEAEATLDIRALPGRGHRQVLCGDGEGHR